MGHRRNVADRGRSSLGKNTKAIRNESMEHFTLVRRPQPDHWSSGRPSRSQLGLSLKTQMKPKTKSRRTWRQILQRRRRMHDPMLVLNMSIFNVGNGWDRTFNPLKAHENGTR